MALTLHDSLSGRPHRIAAGARRGLTLYVCGPTVYAPAHVGHGRTYLYFDVLRRVLADLRIPVRHVMNITDVEDKISARAASLGVTWCQLARREERRFLADLRSLRILRPTNTPRASDYVRRMVEVARHLERKGRVHRAEDGWTYAPASEHAERNFPSGAQLEDRAVPEPGHPFVGGPGDSREFLVWKRQEPPLPSFPSPWGPGVPGWHLECYTMGHDLLGVPVDLHGGGMDLVFPHHYAENEVALTLDGNPFARTFVHTAFVLQNGSKMSKSVGNLVALRPTVREFGADALRWYLLTTPYTRALEWDEAALAAAAEEHARVRALLRTSVAAGAGGSVRGVAYGRLASAVRRTLSDGLRVHDALTAVREFGDVVGRAPAGRVARGERATAIARLATVEDLLGIRLH